MGIAPVLPYVHRVLSPLFPGCLWKGNPERKEIALTFDDGPHPKYTLQLLEALAEYQVTASFFWLGVCVERAPQVAQAVYEQGHWLGLHGYTHRSFPRMKGEQLLQDLGRTRDAIASICNIDPSTLRDVRPPNGVFTPSTLSRLKLGGYRPVMWSVVPVDWVCPGVELVTQRVVEQTQNGSIIVLHDGLCGGQDVAQSVRQLVPQLLDQGYRFVTIDHLWKQQNYMNSSSR
ncbi:Peptidoglycan-N-acetylmuramic acid deacetylase PdaC [Acaryochloris thomasi RCC1774]|uniref:Peptidoglycan-N-acetylmuramic acid deacetylase PdaC n=1 Tax=Acaryochloris thomasi RCC1774 TaxID=1764569 RepID=A0A2W1JSZ1_9CYAN|nr:polysaccharide deacetylase family protein [Acaryochloris thomasi]PZD72091.1 Peptidoglycan-N-acetylmuramic acid deacetylase PdaC [Acaryochloris thomasi RCC1774]